MIKEALGRALMRLRVSLATAGIGPEHPQGNDVIEQFLARCKAMDRPRVLELGTLRSLPERSTRHDAWVPGAAAYLGADIRPGADVDVVVDVHRLCETVGREQFDIIISCSTFEHLKYPHLAAHQIMHALKIGGALFVQTHQSFPIHAYPYDYFRFSREALAGLFGTRMGFRVAATDLEFPVRLYSPREPFLQFMPAYLNTRLYGEKIGPTPESYVYEYDA